MMEATVRIPEVLANQLSKLAAEEGTSLGGLLSLLVSEHTNRRQYVPARRKEVNFPLILKRETGIVYPVTGAGLDEILSLDDIPS